MHVWEFLTGHKANNEVLISLCHSRCITFDGCLSDVCGKALWSGLVAAHCETEATRVSEQ
jgi:hypothetical protein